MDRICQETSVRCIVAFRNRLLELSTSYGSMPRSVVTAKRFAAVDSLRGIAALAMAGYHFYMQLAVFSPAPLVGQGSCSRSYRAGIWRLAFSLS